ncbi:hypothetical protein TorRG33x02_108120 [Trema orientale]|uniref:Uncharacterized protein n=1 Tax=Trema orientale TaxID=63057 RepID=A0A2P5F6W1_TREOI|nr:hypothetical protein TorRG33x02_108120 [Trema orientale]
MEVKSKRCPLLSFVYGVWLDCRFNLRPSYEAIVKGYYKAEIRNTKIFFFFFLYCP